MIQNPEKPVSEVCYSSSSNAREVYQENSCPVRNEVYLCGKEKVNYTHFHVIETLGQGSFGTVSLVRKRGGTDNNKLYAMKVLEKPSTFDSAKLAKSIQTERQVLKSVRGYPFLAKMYYAFQTESKLFIVMQYLNGGELTHHLRKFTEEEVRIYISEIILALEILHKKRIAHRDVKLANILLDEDGHIVLIDYGCAKKFMKTDLIKRTYSICGTLEYNAPEILTSKYEGHGMAVDWWSLGIVTHELLTTKSPFKGETETFSSSIIFEKIINDEPEILVNEESDAYDFIKSLLKKDPAERLGGGAGDADDVKDHPFLKDMNWPDLINKRIPAPIQPKILHELDTSNFTNRVAERPPRVDDNFLIACEAFHYKRLFKGFSFVSN